MPQHHRLHAPGPKRILSLDGGGTRGIIAIAFLERIEALLADATGRGAEFRLSDYFDLIGGTSVGSILATQLAMGERVATVKQRFLDWAPEIFSGRDTLIGIRKFDGRKITNRLRGILKDETQASEKLKTGLAIVAKRVDSGAVWVLCNNPRLRFWNDGPLNGNRPEWLANKDYKLWQLVRASTAAPYHFTPLRLEIGIEEHGVFVDGGISPHNNPALLLFLMSAMKGYGLDWQPGPENLQIISVGAGAHRVRIDPTQKRLPRNLLLRAAGLVNPNIYDDLNEAAFAADTLRGIISDCEQMALMILQGLSKPRLPWPLNSELGTGAGDLAAHFGGEALSFQRYNLGLDKTNMMAPFGIALDADEAKRAHAIDEPAMIDRLHELAAQAAEMQVHIADFQRFLPSLASSPAGHGEARAAASLASGSERAAEKDRAMSEAPFHVAITGHRPNRLPSDQTPRLMRQLDEVMAEIEAAHPGRSFTLLSGLAEGADRLAAHAALARGWTLIALLPFSEARYLRDFPDATAQTAFHDLLAQAAEVHEAPAADAYTDGAQPYAELGDRLIRQADALIAIWDGEAAQGKGGTVDVMDAARAKPIPVVWLHAREDRPPQWLT